MYRFLTAFIILQLHSIDSARILCAFPFPSISHQIVFRALAEELASRGHDLTVITSNPSYVTTHNYREIDTREISYKIWTSAYDFIKEIPTRDFIRSMSVLNRIYDAQLSLPEVKTIMDEEFDLVIVQNIAVPMYGLAWKLGAPLVLIGSFEGSITNYEYLGCPTHPFFYTDMFNPQLRVKTLAEKFRALVHYYKWWYAEKTTDVVYVKLLEKHFGKGAPTISELYALVDMMFVNVYPVLGTRPLVPQVVYLGGLHLKPTRQLPAELKSFLDSSPQGVVYMSLGSNVQSRNLPAQTLRMMLEVFRALPYRVLWKYEEDHLAGTPANVRLARWLPQADLLGHPNIRCFVMQGGQQSMEEAIRATVPLVGIPFFADQFLNVQKIQEFQIGLGLDLNTLTKERMTEAIMNVTTQSSFKENMRMLSELVNDQPMTAMERAVWWTEYVIRHKGTKHLRSPAADASNFEYFMLDIVGIALAALLLSTAFLVAVINSCRRLVKRKVKRD